MSLRARLIIGLVSQAAIGLLLAGAITHAEQRRFLNERVDGQLDAAVPVVQQAFDDSGPGLPSGDPAELFERFWRGTGPTRPRGRGRAGAPGSACRSSRRTCPPTAGVLWPPTPRASVRDERSGSRGAAGVPLVGDE